MLSADGARSMLWADGFAGTRQSVPVSRQKAECVALEAWVDGCADEDADASRQLGSSAFSGMNYSGVAEDEEQDRAVSARAVAAAA